MHEWNVYLRLDELMYQNITRCVEYDGLKKILIEFQQSFSGVFNLPEEGKQFFSDDSDFLHFVLTCYTVQHNPDYGYIPYGKPIRADSDSGFCQWPGCKKVQGLDRDHLIPSSVIKKIHSITKITTDKEMRDRWVEFNSATLCRRHNQNVKNDSIGTGIWLMSLLKNS